MLCPHPDDFDVAAVTLKSFEQRGSEIYVAVAPTSSGVLDSFYDAEASSMDRIITREGEQRESMLFFGLQESNFEFLPRDCDLDSNGELTPSDANQALIGEVILKQQPDAIFIPHPNDSNPAHSAMYAMVKEVLLKNHFEVALFKQMDPKTADLRIDSYTPMSAEDVAWKAELFAHHRTQDHRNRESRGVTLADRMQASNTAIARTHGLPCKAAEAFEIEFFIDSLPVDIESD